jgi:hypothetical protein
LFERRKDEEDASTDSSASASTQLGDRSGRPPLAQHHVLSGDTDGGNAATSTPGDEHWNAARSFTGRRSHDNPDPAASPQHGGLLRTSVDGGRQRRRRLTAAGETDALETENAGDAFTGPRPYARVGHATPTASPMAPQWQQQPQEVREPSKGSQSPRIAAHFERHLHDPSASEVSDGAVMSNATSGARRLAPSMCPGCCCLLSRVHRQVLPCR